MARVTTPEGTFELNTEEGCVGFIGQPCRPFITSNLEGPPMETRPVQQNLPTLTIWGCCGSFLPLEAKTAVPLAQKEALVGLLHRWLADPPRSPRWQQTGELAPDVSELLKCMIGWSTDVAVCQVRGAAWRGVRRNPPRHPIRGRVYCYH